MRVLGVSYGYHDSSACLVVDGRVVEARAEERLSRQKHDANFPALAISEVLGRHGLKPSDVDQVVFHEDPHAKFSRVLAAALSGFPHSRLEFVESMKAWLGRKLWSLPSLSSRLDVPPGKITYLSHHFSHAVQAFMGSGFEESAILVVDAVGDWASTALFKGRWESGRPVIERLFELGFPNSIGLVYSAFTAHLGFSPNDAECSTMALAAFGRPTFAEAMRQMVRPADDGTYDVDQSYFHFTNFYKGAVTGKFNALFGPSRPFSRKLPFASFGAMQAVGDEEQRLADAAHAVQQMTEERLLALARRLHKEMPSENLCYAGGVSLNCVANRRLLADGPFKRIHIPPDPGDGGTAIGAALYGAALLGDATPASVRYGPFLGARHSAEADVAMMDHVKPAHVARYLKIGLESKTPLAFRSRTFASSAERAAFVADRLMEGRIVGWFQGAAELGPRALGNRSILIRPDDVALATRLSRDVKDRAAFRPYAFSVAAEGAPALLDLPPEHIDMHRWMQFSAAVRPQHVAQVRAALHVDLTTRPQVCTADENPGYHALLTAFGERFGLPVLLNTSFNPSGYPIVSTPAEALAMFARTGMDLLVLEDAVVWKETEEGR